MLDRLGRHTEVLHHAQRALELYGAAGHLSGEASAHNGWDQLGRYVVCDRLVRTAGSPPARARRS